MNVYIEHANVTVKSIQESSRLLQAAFPDFQLRGEGVSGDKRWAHFGNEVIYLTLNEPLEGKADALAKNYAVSGLNHLAFVVDDIDSIDQRLQASGYKSDPVFQEESELRRRHYYEDSNGLEWEFVQYLTDDLSLRNHY
ncbi:lactoylglutathione lyase [Endozoicomonas sp. OPT23]|uniref:VOC family protein n=1 Tax=Endozoicomonas sp. OPT23 TaxID=2072845 RepID=UPI00129B4F81|nr:VOC family protein [Endozoicomonas sp. OPT23]MRI31526.1 lactoylglutathione lyase [Endozoicomonas sp. OPT23]